MGGHWPHGPLLWAALFAAACLPAHAIVGSQAFSLRPGEASEVSVPVRGRNLRQDRLCRSLLLVAPALHRRPYSRTGRACSLTLCSPPTPSRPVPPQSLTRRLGSRASASFLRPPLTQFGFDAGGTVSLQVALFDANGTDMRKHPGWSPPAEGVYLLSCEVRAPSHRCGR